MLMSVSNCSQYKAPTRTDVNPLSFLTRTSISLLDMGLPSPRRWAPIIMTDPSFVLKGFREVTNTPSCSPNAADEEHRRDNGSVLRGGLDGYLGVNACDRGREGVHFDLDHTDNICDAPLHQFQPVLPRLGLDCTLDTSDSPIPYSAQDRVRTPAEVLNDGIRYTASMFKNARSFIIHDSTFNDAANDINFGREFPDGRQSLDVDLDESQEAHRRSGIFTNRHSTSESSGTDAHRDEGGGPCGPASMLENSVLSAPYSTFNNAGRDINIRNITKNVQRTIKKITKPLRPLRNSIQNISVPASQVLQSASCYAEPILAFARLPLKRRDVTLITLAVLAAATAYTFNR
ncbi:hypothetical protein HGRIS_000397 [Hohenbuehelia grisea]|uniref:Uncharacterized protein n=1 Tax=Hohenbuehelia grisea TaxID=104357 RepID=A0ABR3JSX7_9AGAR